MSSDTEPKPNPKSESQILRRHDLTMAVSAYLASDVAARSGRHTGIVAQKQQVRRIQKRYWPIIDEVLVFAITRRRGSSLELTDDERLFMDLGLVDSRMVEGVDNALQITRTLMAEVREKGAGSYYFSEWLTYRQQQAQLESELNWDDHGEEQQTGSYASQLSEARRRVLTRLSSYLTGLPGVPLEMSNMMRSGDLDRAVITSGLAALASPGRKNFLRRHQLWNLREQILSKARARVENPSMLRLFEMLNEVYMREWRSRHDAFVHGEAFEESQQAKTPEARADTMVYDVDSHVIMREARRMRGRIRLLETVDGRDDSETILYGDGPRMTKPLLSTLTRTAQTFDRSLTAMPPIIIAPCIGRGFFVWESGCLLVALRPLVSTDDSLATALGWMRILTDRFQNDGALRKAYEKAFPGVNFPAEFPADYRSWLCRLTKGDDSALSPEKRAFFRNHVGPELSGPLLPPNLRGVGPQTMMAICRRLEKQVGSGDGDPNLHRRLAAIYWQQGEIEAAGLQFNAAMQLAPEDGETLFTTGMFMRSRGDMEAANDCFRFGADRAPETMWGVYCRDALAGDF